MYHVLVCISYHRYIRVRTLIPAVLEVRGGEGGAGMCMVVMLCVAGAIYSERVTVYPDRYTLCNNRACPRARTHNIPPLQ